MEFWRSQVQSLSPKKQGTWKSTSRDCRGTHHQIRFRNGYFQVKVDAKLIKDCVPPIDGWAPVMQLGGTPTEEQLQASYGNVVPEGVPQDHELTEESAQIRAAMEGCRLEGIAEELFRRAVVHNAMEARRTGNHRRNHMIAVPTAVGQPLRG
jgi:hypothetical protein